MPRRPRVAPVGVPQHVVQRGINRMPTFVTASDYLHYHECLSDACRRYDCAVHAYVLMTNHVHLVMTPYAEGAIADVMRLLGARYVRYFNAVRRRTGALWEGRYRASLIDSERYLLRCYQYVELNPVRAAMVADPAAYRWTSHRANAFGDDDSLVTPHPTYVALGADAIARRESYRALVLAGMQPDVQCAIRIATRASGPLRGA